MTVAQLLNGIVTAGTVAGALSALAVVAHFAAVRPLRAFIRREIAVPLAEISDAMAGIRTSLEHHINDPAAHSRER